MLRLEKICNMYLEYMENKYVVLLRVVIFIERAKITYNLIIAC